MTPIPQEEKQTWSSPETAKPAILAGLWELANISPRETRGSVWSQKQALRQILDLRGGFSFLISQPAKQLDQLAQRNIFGGRHLLMELTNLELQRRRLEQDLANVRRRTQQILDYELVPSTPKRQRKERRETSAAVK